MRPVLVFDRGYARVPLMQLLDSLGVYWAIRVRKGTWVRYRHERGLRAGRPIRSGALLWWSHVRYHQHALYQANLAITHAPSAAEPWFLLTNLPRAATAVRWHERRFRCEELFRDMKDQLHQETIRVRCIERVERILFCLLMAYLALTLIGVAGQRAGMAHKVCQHKGQPCLVGPAAPGNALAPQTTPHPTRPLSVFLVPPLRKWVIARGVSNAGAHALAGGSRARRELTE